MFEPDFSTWTVHLQIQRAIGRLYEFPGAFEGERAEIVGGVHTYHIETELHNVGSGDVGEWELLALSDRTEAVLRHSRNVSPRHFVEPNRRRIIPHALQTIRIRIEVRLAIATLYGQFAYGHFDLFAFLGLETVDATENEPPSKYT